MRIMTMKMLLLILSLEAETYHIKQTIRSGFHLMIEFVSCFFFGGGYDISTLVGYLRPNPFLYK